MSSGEGVGVNSGVDLSDSEDDCSVNDQWDDDYDYDNTTGESDDDCDYDI